MDYSALLAVARQRMSPIIIIIIIIIICRLLKCLTGQLYVHGGSLTVLGAPPLTHGLYVCIFNLPTQPYHPS